MWPACVDKTLGKLAYWRERPPGPCIVSVSKTNRVKLQLSYRESRF
jgi:hypothetical protein